jgi:hypothetical protein
VGFQSMDLAASRSPSSSSFSHARLSASIPAIDPAAVPLIPSAPTRIFPVTPCASHVARRRSTTPDGSRSLR